MSQVDLLPAKRAQFRRPQPMPEGQQDHRGVPVPMAIVASRLHQPLNFALGQVFAGAIVGIRQPTSCNCSLLDRWCVSFWSRLCETGLRRLETSAPTAIVTVLKITVIGTVMDWNGRLLNEIEIAGVIPLSRDKKIGKK
jgi:hypothetical protein